MNVLVYWIEYLEMEHEVQIIIIARVKNNQYTNLVI